MDAENYYSISRDPYTYPGYRIISKYQVLEDDHIHTATMTTTHDWGSGTTSSGAYMYTQPKWSDLSTEDAKDIEEILTDFWVVGLFTGSNKSVDIDSFKRVLSSRVNEEDVNEYLALCDELHLDWSKQLVGNKVTGLVEMTRIRVRELFADKLDELRQRSASYKKKMSDLEEFVRDLEKQIEE